ncbi:MAG TPA: terminase small subunit [Gammaproteobacteria bacterium]|nr:terminase small subunit [Gammaproteobacteria bacterium]
MAIFINHALTPKQNAFAVQYVATGNASEAYRRAYNATNMKRDTIHSRASELLKHGGIAARVTQLKADLATDNEVTFGEVAAALRASIKAAMEAGQYSAAVSACMGLAKLGGLLVEKRRATIAGYPQLARYWKSLGSRIQKMTHCWSSCQQAALKVPGKLFPLFS